MREGRREGGEERGRGSVVSRVGPYPPHHNSSNVEGRGWLVRLGGGWGRRAGRRDGGEQEDEDVRVRNCSCKTVSSL